MKKQQEELIKNTLSATNAVSGLSVDKINELAPATQSQLDEPLTAKEKAKLEGARYIEPKRRLSPIGKLPEKLKRQHEYDWEYVKGIFRYDGINLQLSNEPMEFWFAKYPGDHDCLWSIPPNVACYVPRMIAVHLSGERDPVTGIETMKYHKFDYVEKNPNSLRSDSYTHDFQPITTEYRGKFSPIGAFN